MTDQSFLDFISFIEATAGSAGSRRLHAARAIDLMRAQQEIARKRQQAARWSTHAIVADLPPIEWTWVGDAVVWPQ